jgi:hypothetical protein
LSAQAILTQSTFCRYGIQVSISKSGCWLVNLSPSGQKSMGRDSDDDNRSPI